MPQKNETTLSIRGLRDIYMMMGYHLSLQVLKAHMQDTVSLIGLLAACYEIELKRGYFMIKDLYAVDYHGGKRNIKILYDICKKKEYVKCVGVDKMRQHQLVVSDKGVQVLTDSVILTADILHYYRMLPARLSRQAD